MNKVVLITGAARRIGASIAEAFHQSGYDIIVHCNSSVDAGEDLVNRLCELRANSAKLIQQDLANLDDGKDFAARCLNLFSRIDVLVNNACVFTPTPLAAITPLNFNQIVTTNLTAPLFLSTAIANTMTQGSIINIIDIHGATPLRNYIAYSTSKAGLIMLTKSLALELAPDIRVNGVSPGAILWPEAEAEMGPSEQSDLVNKIPAGKIGSPTDIAATAVFLAASSTFITGQIIAVDGGQSI